MNNEDTFTFHEATGLWFDYHEKSKAWRIMRDMYLVNTQGCAPWEPEYYENREAVVAELDKRALFKKNIETQNKQRDFLNKMESREHLGDGRSYLCKCHDCGKVEQFSSAGTVGLMFLNEHHGHKTWINLMKGWSK